MESRCALTSLLLYKWALVWNVACVTNPLFDCIEFFSFYFQRFFFALWLFVVVSFGFLFSSIRFRQCLELVTATCNHATARMCESGNGLCRNAYIHNTCCVFILSEEQIFVHIYLIHTKLSNIKSCSISCLEFITAFDACACWKKVRHILP